MKNNKKLRELKFSTSELLRFLLGLVESFAWSGEPAVSATWGNENPEQAENKDKKFIFIGGHWKQSHGGSQI